MSEISELTPEINKTPVSPLQVQKVDHHSVEINWANCEDFDSTLCFQLKKRDSNTNNSTKPDTNVYTGYATKYQITQLKPGQVYQFRLSQKEGKVLSDWITVHTSHNPITIHDLCKLIKRKKSDNLKQVLNNSGEDSRESGVLSSLDAVNDLQLSPLMEAASSNYLEGVKLLLDSHRTRNRSSGQIPGASINYVDPVNGRTALMYACRNGSLKSMEYLSMGLVDIEHPEPVANWGIYDRSGLTALHWLVDPKSSVNTEYMAVCLDWIDKHSESLKGFSWHYKEIKTQWSILHRACTRGAPADAIAKLIKICDVCEFDAGGMTPLMLAVLSGNYQTCTVLLSLAYEQILDQKSRDAPHRIASDMIGTAPSNKRQLRELFRKYENIKNKIVEEEDKNHG